MSMMLMVKAMSLEVGNPTRKLVLIKLADQANDKGECYPSYSTIAKAAECSKRSAMTHVEQLEKDGFLIIQRRKVKDNQNLSNVYILTLDKAQQPSENSALGGSENISLGSENSALGSETVALGGSENISPKPVNNNQSMNQSMNQEGVTRKTRTTKSLHADDLNALLNLGVDKQIAQDWLQTRKDKRAGSLTPTVVAGLQREAAKAGLTVPQAVQVAAERNWARFVASYLQNEQQGFSGSQKPQGNRITRTHKHGEEAKSGLARDVLKGIL
ncbi:helix-turn-helix domain-containing protein [Kingella negevensis]|uniref:helix-turn-helix domain-containing protein n=1 Tax=Kingella negevensis TaxID=1522312 RepID=UPI002550B776|nr:helix-turn-helix domain-containing protein [Kingella negevensis]MDK4689671.1 helix-turn-helix domain-containing protein [Kingella negevensis]